MSVSVQWDVLENFAASLNGGDYVAKGWSSIYNGSTNVFFLAANSALGKNAIELDGNYSGGQYWRLNLGWRGGAPVSPTFSCRALIPTGQTGNASFQLMDYNNAVMGTVAINSANGIITISDSTGIKYTSPYPIITTNVPFFIEFFLLPSHTNGTITVRINEAIISAPFTGLNTDPNSIGSVQNVNLVPTSGMLFYVTDIGVLDTSISGNPQFYGDNNIQYLTATANGATVNFTPNGLAANWQNVSQIPPNASDYNSSQTPGNTDEFVVGNLSALTESVGGIFVVSNAENISGGLHTYSRQWSGSSGNTYASGSAVTLTNGYIAYGDSPTTDPNTSAAWTVAGVNGMKIGYTLVS